MSGMFFNLGRKLGQAVVPALRKSKWIWQSVAGTEEESIQAETKFGRAMAEELRARMKPAEDPQDRELVEEIGRRLAAIPGLEGRVFHVETMQAGSANAMALPGGFIFVDVSLLDICQRQPDELAFVMGHEMAHVIKRHTFDRILRRVGTEVITNVLGRGTLGVWLRQSGIGLLQSAHSQDIELEADELGSDAAVAAGYDPQAALRLLKRLHQGRDEEGGISEYFASHPPERIRAAHLKAHWEERDSGSQ